MGKTLVAGVAAGAAGAAASLASHASASARSQLFGSTFVCGTDHGQLALTYDDGPNDPYTGRLLDLLAKHDVRATFFVIGRYVAQRPDLARRISQAGHVIGNHTYSHPNLIFTWRTRIQQELAGCEQALCDAVGEHSQLFRPCFGARRPGVLKLARAAGLLPVMWSVNCYDWRSGISAQKIEQHARRQISKHSACGNVLLMHDGGHRHMGADRANTLQATERLITRYKGEGLQFVTVPEMM